MRHVAAGGKRALGRELQKHKKKAWLLDPSRLEDGEQDRRLAGIGGLVSFGGWWRAEGVDEQLEQQFGDLNSGSEVYPMSSVQRLLIDAAVVGIPRDFGIEALADDPLVTLLQGGAVPSIDTTYRKTRSEPARCRAIFSTRTNPPCSSGCWPTTWCGAWVLAKLPAKVHRWRADWIRKMAVLVPARLVYSSRQCKLRLAPRPLLN